MNNGQGIKLINATYLNEYNIELRFSDNTVRQINFEIFLKTHSHPQFDKYKKLNNFRKFKIERGNIVWGKNWDLIFDLWELYDGINPV